MEKVYNKEKSAFCKWFIKKSLENKKCVICGRKEAPLHFFNMHYKKSISRDAHGGSADKILGKIDNSIVLCMNCRNKGEHKACRKEDFIKLMQTDPEFQNNRHFKRMRTSLTLNSYKAKIGCQRCRNKDHEQLTFHHRDPKKKSKTISKIGNDRIKKVKEEVMKCDVLCHNCHILHHLEEEN